MRYFEILKQRRLDLNLSLQDIAIQTQLSASQLRAIEEHDLAFFQSELTYVRILIQAYCKILGVNWQALSPEIDQDLEDFIQKQSAVQKSEPEVKPKRQLPQKKARTVVQLANRNRLFLFVGAGLCLLFVLNYFFEQSALMQAANAARIQEEELAYKQEETRQLADQLKAIKSRSSVYLTPEIAVDAEDPTLFYISGVIDENGMLALEFESENTSEIRLYEKGTLLYMQRVRGEAGYDLSVNSPKSVQIQWNDFEEGDAIYAGGTALSLNIPEEEDLQITLEIVDEIPYVQESEYYGFDQLDPDPEGVYGESSQ